jgi:hypothetical protein
VMRTLERFPSIRGKRRTETRDDEKMTQD